MRRTRAQIFVANAYVGRWNDARRAKLEKVYVGEVEDQTMSSYQYLSECVASYLTTKGQKSTALNVKSEKAFWNKYCTGAKGAGAKNVFAGKVI